jgi:4-hydroxy-tetrahydrodipicolinate reductase
MVTIPIIINGALGKMGIEIAGAVLADSAVSLVACVDREDHPSRGQDYGLCIGKGPMGIAVIGTVDVKGAENAVIIDFSSPQSTRALLEKADAHGGSPMVIGTTGLSEADYALAKRLSLKVPLLISPNMSLGVNLLFSLAEIVTKKIGNDFDIEIIEAHHRFKKDAPSGTAKKIGEIVAGALHKDYEAIVRHGRSGMAAGERPRSEIGMHAVRGGDIVGDHTVLFAGIGERVELRHMAHNRRPLACGAVAAAKWLSSQKPGYYSMRDVLGI